MRRAVAVAILATFAGLVIEVEAAGPFGDIQWWRAPMTGALVVGSAGALRWAQHELRGPADDLRADG